MSSKKIVLILCMIVVVAGGLRFMATLKTDAFWFDEVVSVTLAQKNIPEMMQYLVYENHPPLHYLLLHWWIKVFGASEISVWWSSIATGLLAVVAIYCLAKELFDKKTGLVAAFLVAVSPFHVFYSTEGRMYELLFVLIILSVLFFVRFLKNKKNVDLVLYVFFTLMALYTHLSTLSLLAAGWLFFIWWWFKIERTKDNWKKWLVSQLIIIVLFLPWLIQFIYNKIFFMEASAWYFNTAFSQFFMLSILKKLVVIGNSSSFVGFVINLVIFGLFFLGLFKIFKNNKGGFEIWFHNNRWVVLCLFLCLIPLIGGVILSINVFKYYLVSGLGFYLLISFGTGYIKFKKSLLLIFFLLFALFFPANVNIFNQRISAWRKCINYVEEKEGGVDKIVFSLYIHQLPFKYYYNGSLLVDGLFFGKEASGDMLEDVIKYNVYPPSALLEDLSGFNGLLSDTERVLYIYSINAFPTYQASAQEWLLRNNWRVVEKKDFKDAHDAPGVMLLERIQSN